MKTGTRLVFFDENLTRTSPAGSCMLTALRGLGSARPIEVVCNRLEQDADLRCRKITVPLPRGPVLARTVLFTILSCGASRFRSRSEKALKISTEGAYPFCDVSYAHCCHRLFLKRYRSRIGGRLLRRTARLLTHSWGAFTERSAFHRAKIVVVPSRGLARDLAEVYGTTVEGKIRVLANPVDVEYFRKPMDFRSGAVRHDLGFGSEPVLFSFCALGNFEWKGLRLALEAMGALRDARVKLLVIGGQKSEIAEYVCLVERSGLAKQVYFAGLQSDIRPFLWASDAFLFPSAHETFPLVCLQAAAAGLPLLTTRLYGVEDFAQHGETGWFMERTVDSVMQALRTALENYADLPRMGEAARARVAGYGVDQFQARWRELIEELVRETTVSQPLATKGTFGRGSVDD